MLLSEALDGYYLSHIADGYSPLTMTTYLSALRILSGFLHDPNISEISETDLKRFFGHLRTSYAPEHSDSGQLSTASLHRYWKAIRSFFKWADASFGVGRPDAAFKMPRYANKEIIPYSENDVQRLLTACRQSRPIAKAGKREYHFRPNTAERNIAILLLFLDTGLRPGELARLKIGDIDLSSGEIQVKPYRSGKTRPRIVIASAKTRKAIWRYQATRGECEVNQPAFLTNDGCEMTRHTLGSLVANLGRRAGVPNANPYRFRHTFAIEYLRNGGDVFTLQRLLGHATLEMCRVYLRLAQTDVATAHRRASPVDRWRV